MDKCSDKICSRACIQTLQVILLLSVLVGIVSCGSLRLKTSSTSMTIPKDSLESDTASKIDTSKNTKKASRQDTRGVVENSKDTSSKAKVDSLGKEDKEPKKKKDTGPKPLVCTVNPGIMAGSGNGDEVRLKGTVVCSYEGVELRTKEAVWNQEREVVYCIGGMNIKANGYTLQSKKGEYRRLDEIILAYGDVTAEDEEKEHSFFAEELKYNQKTKAMKWVGDATFSRIYVSTRDSANLNDKVDSSKIDNNKITDTLRLSADTIQYNDSLKEAWAIQNVKLVRGKLEVHSDYGNYQEKKQLVKMTGNPKAKLEESVMKGDTMYVTLDREKIKGVSLQGNAVGDFVEKTEGSVETYVLKGDSLYMKLLDDYLETVDILSKTTVSKATHESSKHPSKVNEMMGDILKLSFENRNIKETWIKGNASSIYHLYDKEVYQGKNEARGKEIRIEFAEGRLQKVAIQGNANGTYWGKSGGKKKAANLDSIRTSP